MQMIRVEIDIGEIDPGNVGSAPFENQGLFMLQAMIAGVRPVVIGRNAAT
jgi:hypothetical protein